MHVHLLHIGYPKTASSTLQRHVFRPELGWWSVAGQPFTYHEEIVERFAQDGWREGFLAELLQRRLRPSPDDGLLRVLSFEGHVGEPLMGGAFGWVAQRELARLFPEAVVLLVIREQIDMILSLYNHHVATGLAQSLAQFLRAPSSLQRIPPFTAAYLEYDRMADQLAQVFGARRVQFVLFEQLVAAPGEALRPVYQRCGGTAPDSMPPLPRENTGRPMAAVGARRLVNLLFWERDVNPAPPFPLRDWTVRTWNARLARYAARVAPARAQRRKRQLREQALRLLGPDRYAASNTRLLERHPDLPLARFGYQLPPA